MLEGEPLPAECLPALVSAHSQGPELCLEHGRYLASSCSVNGLIKYCKGTKSTELTCHVSKNTHRHTHARTSELTEQSGRRGAEGSSSLVREAGRDACTERRLILEKGLPLGPPYTAAIKMFTRTYPIHSGSSDVSTQ